MEDKLELKQEIFDSTRSLIQEKESSFRKEIVRLEQDAMHRESDQLELEQRAQDESETDVSNRLVKQLDFAQKELAVLENLGGQKQLMEEVQPGAVVVTNKGAFYVSVATDSFAVNGWKARGLSEDAPIYEAMHGKEEGDTFAFRNVEYVIKEIF